MRAHEIVKKVFGAATKWSKLLSLLLPPPLRPPTLPILPAELIELILLRLPARSLLKFKRVCKSWKTLISSSDFTKNQVQLSIMAEPAISEIHLVYTNLLRHSDSKIGFISIQSLFENLSFGTEVVYFPMDDCVKILGSCNGFLCLNNHPKNTDFKVRLLNPCIGLASEWLTLHSEYDQQRPISNFGFGYDHVNDKFKILAVVESSTRIYTFGEYSWVSVQDIPLHPLEWDGTFVTGTGTLNWLATKIASFITYPVHQTTIVVLSFNFGNESYDQIALPNFEGGMIHREPVLVTLRNSLCVCHEYKKSVWDLWMMKEYGNEVSWTRMLVISHDQELIPRAHGIGIRPLHMMENDLLLVLVRPPWYQLAVYNPANKGDRFGYPVINYYSSDDDMPNYNNPRGCFYVYRESLVSPSHYGLKTDHVWLWDDDDDDN
ncbi:F-box/kelch-repeat protein At3g23880-like [Arachis duranensis]|uniref:F-box/kelch-repeat protein At3g23880-like n=1 Tax=Arachis duranensis TaxID=130453 RepID=A0A6P4BER9_ARADU|nr:F-box/kelch-repeat protein At3g23880-like [Arachis duranensis]